MKVGRFYPSTQTCSTCQHITGPKGRNQLKVRHWTCTNCGTSHDRDTNAARNILTEGLRLHADNTAAPHPTPTDSRESLNACGDGIRPASPLAPVCEAGRTAGDREQVLT